MKILSFNIRIDNPKDEFNAWEYRKNAVIDYINNQDASVIFLQEVNEKQFADINAGVKEKWSIVWFKREIVNTEGLAILFDNTLYSKENHYVFWLSPTPHVMSKGWGAMCYRICLALSLKDKNGKIISLYNVHLDHKSIDARNNSIKLILERLNSEGVNVVAGDFNTNDDSECYGIISSNMQDCQKAVKNAKNCNTFHKWGTIVGGKPIDFIFVDNCVKVVNFSILESDRFVNDQGEERFLSDHFAIKTEIKY